MITPAVFLCRQNYDSAIIQLCTMSSGYVYQGLWRKWDGHPGTLIWTVTNLNAVIIMGVVTALLAVAQSRAWVISRHLFIRITQPNRIPDALEDLSQLTAFKDLFNILFRSSIHRRQSHNGDYKHPAGIGLVAIVNCLVFIAAGVMLPWFLTDGALGAPEVRSQRTHNCTDSWAGGLPGNLINSNLLLAGSIWDQCHDKKSDDSYCDPNFVRTKTYVTSLLPGCIFPSQICLPSQPMAIFTRANLTPHDLGVNVNFQMSVSHRIFCNPISLGPFIHKINRSAKDGSELGDFTLSIQDTGIYNVTESTRNLELNMWTDNGPDSGRDMFRKKTRFFAQVLLEPGSDTPENFKRMHPLLAFRDVQIFVLVLKAGGTMYVSPVPITDPLFQASKLAIGPEYTNFYAPDREATGIGCGEQTQLCVDLPSGRKCYPWTKGVHYWPETLREDLRQFDDFDAVQECMAVFYRDFGPNGIGASGLQFFLLKQFLLEHPLLAKGHGVGPDHISMVTNINTQFQWIFELAALLNKAGYWQKINFLATVRNSLDRKDSTPTDLGRYSLCDKILFIDADYTSIKWLEMWMVLGVQVLLCLTSYGIPLLDRDVRQRLRTDTSNWVQKKLRRMRQVNTDISKWVQKKLGGIRPMFKDTLKWIRTRLVRGRGISQQNIALSTLPAQARRLYDEEPDNTLPLALPGARRAITVPGQYR
jgi:hypothetical protein